MITFSAPFFLRFAGNFYASVCAQAQYAGANAPITIAAVDPTGQTPNQQWSMGSDGRIYLWGGTAPTQFCIGFVQPQENGQPLQLMTADQSDQTQQWVWSHTMTCLLNVGAENFAIDDENGDTAAENKIQLWTNLENSNQAWVFQLLAGSALAQ